MAKLGNLHNPETDPQQTLLYYLSKKGKTLKL